MENNEVTKLLENWFNEITFGDNKNIDFYIKKTPEGEEGPERSDFKFYTNNYVYSITAIEKPPNSKRRSYFGCTMSCRKPKAGEDWVRGNDLPDGLLNKSTWNKIKNAIIRNELVKLESKREQIPDTIEGPAGVTGLQGKDNI